MSALEIIIALFGGIVAGTVFSILISKYLKPEFPGNTKAPESIKTIPEIGKKFEVEQARLRFKTLKLEKELHTDALSRVFQAEGDGRITKKERDMLSERYRDQIKSLDKNLQDSELILEASELENLHDELSNLFSQKLNQVERRLNELTVKLDSVKSFNKPDVSSIVKDIPNKSEAKPSSVSAPKKLKVTPKLAGDQSISSNDESKKQVAEDKSTAESDAVVKKQSPKKPKDTPSADDKVNEIRDEVLEALNRLEQMDVEE